MIVFSDMDGTLLTSDKQMSDATWAMLDELARRGIEFVPCTGRPLSGVFEPILAHPAVHYAVCANGASVWQLDENAPTDASRATCILSRPLDRDIAHCIHRIAAGHDVTFDIFADGQCFLPRSLYERLDEFCGGDPHIAGSLRRTRTPIDVDVDSKIDEVETLERIAMYWARPRRPRRHRGGARHARRDRGHAFVRNEYRGHGRGRHQGNGSDMAVRASGRAPGRCLGLRRQHQRHPHAAGRRPWHGHDQWRARGPRGRGAITEFDNDHDGVARTIMAALA